MTQGTVAGEPIEVLVRAFAKLERRSTSDGMVELEGTLELDLGEPLMRAMLRIEGELLARDMAEDNPNQPTAEQRAADAFVLLTERLASELGPSWAVSWRSEGRV